MNDYCKRNALILSVVSALLALGTVAGLAQTLSGGSFTVTSSVTAGGGGKSIGSGNVGVEGTSGQSAAGGPHANSPFSHDAGFWPTTQAAPTPTPLAGPGAFAFSSPNFSVNEDTIEGFVAVNRLNGSTGVATVDYRIMNGLGFTPCNVVNGIAAQNCDFSYTGGTLTFANGEVTKTVSVLISKDAYIEGNEAINLSLNNPTAGATLAAQTSTTLMIIDNPSVPTNSQPIDDPVNFVGQTYHDFLARQADAAGLSFWSGQITQCGSDQNCINSERITVSNAFFFELEYQQTGSYVFRLYRAAYGNNQPLPNPDNSNVVEAKKIPAYSAFVADRASVIGGTNLAQSQLDLANAFVQRPEFLAKYPASLNGAQFIAAVLQNIQTNDAADLSSQTAALTLLFNQGGRGAVIYRLADDNTQTNPITNQPFIDAEYDRAFVATQYFGYLRRDADIGGLLFWFNQVNSAPLRDVNEQHRMVCSFITSAEYQNRFSAAITHTNAECP
jgi:hypothetical protein